MKILFLIRSLHLGGTERQLEILANGLRERGHDVVVASFYAEGPLDEALQKAGVKGPPVAQARTLGCSGIPLSIGELHTTRAS